MVFSLRRQGELKCYLLSFFFMAFGIHHDIFSLVIDVSGFQEQLLGCLTCSVIGEEVFRIIRVSPEDLRHCAIVYTCKLTIVIVYGQLNIKGMSKSFSYFKLGYSLPLYANVTVAVIVIHSIGKFCIISLTGGYLINDCHGSRGIRVVNSACLYSVKLSTQ